MGASSLRCPSAEVADGSRARASSDLPGAGEAGGPCARLDRPPGRQARAVEAARPGERPGEGTSPESPPASPAPSGGQARGPLGEPRAGLLFGASQVPVGVPGGRAASSGLLRRWRQPPESGDWAPALPSASPPSCPAGPGRADGSGGPRLSGRQSHSLCHHYRARHWRQDN